MSTRPSRPTLRCPDCRHAYQSESIDRLLDYAVEHQQACGGIMQHRMGMRRTTSEPTPIRSKADGLARVEDALWLLDCGEHPEHVVTRCGFRSLDALDQALRRAGHHRQAVQTAARSARGRKAA